MCADDRFFVSTVGLTTVVGLLCWAGAVVLGLSLDSTRAAFWTVSTFLMLLVHVAVVEPLKVLVLAAFWSNARKNVPK